MNSDLMEKMIAGILANEPRAVMISDNDRNMLRNIADHLDPAHDFRLTPASVAVHVELLWALIQRPGVMLVAVPAADEEVTR